MTRCSCENPPGSRPSQHLILGFTPLVSAFGSDTEHGCLLIHFTCFTLSPKHATLFYLTYTSLILHPGLTRQVRTLTRRGKYRHSFSCSMTICTVRWMPVPRNTVSTRPLPPHSPKSESQFSPASKKNTSQPPLPSEKTRTRNLWRGKHGLWCETAPTSPRRPMGTEVFPTLTAFTARRRIFSRRLWAGDFPKGTSQPGLYCSFPQI